MTQCYIGEIMLFAGTYAPAGWLVCDGSSQSTSGDYATLYALIGNTFGGNQSAFQLPDLRGRVPVHQGVAQTGTSYVLGATGGSESVTLGTQQLPSHTHQMAAANVDGDTANPTNGVALSALGPSGVAGLTYTDPGGPQIGLANTSVSSSGSSQPHGNVQPSVGMNYIICWAGVWPTASS